MQYLHYWSELKKSNSSSITSTNRPPPLAMLFDNTTVQGSWTNVDMEEKGRRYGRIIHSLTMVMPHAGVFEASRLEENGMIQPLNTNVRSLPPSAKREY